MTELSAGPNEKARKALARVLQAMQSGWKGGAVAVALGVSDSTVSRIKNEQMEGVLLLLYALGFKVVEQGKSYVDQNELRALRAVYCRVMSDEDSASRLFEDDE